MNCKKFIRGFAMLCASSFLWVSCKKDDIKHPETIVDNNSAQKLSGVAPDDPAMVAKLPTIASADFLADKITNYFSYQPQTESAKSGGGSTGRDRTTPNVSIVNPATGATVSNTVNVQVTATDNVAVSSVVLKVDGTVIGTGNTAPYNFSWNTAGLSSGTHTLTATATDAAGNSKISTIQVGYNTPSGADITPPSVTITSPANGASVESSVNVGIAASDNIGISSVSFKVDGAIVGTDNDAPYSFSWNTTTVAAGVHSLTATATDAAGNSNSSSIQVTVNTVVVPPTTLPASYQLTMPPVRNQGTEGSCVAFAVVYAARSAEQYYKTNATSYSDGTNIFSPEYVFNQVNLGGTCTSSSIVPSLDLMKNQGVSTWSTMPYSTYDGCSTMPTITQKNEAANFKITSYSTIIAADQIAIKTMIANSHPVIASINIDQQFYEATPGFIWKSFTTNSGYHTLTICGYDDAKHAYKAINSWGTNWGDAGFIWIDYDFFPTVSSYYTYSIGL